MINWNEVTVGETEIVNPCVGRKLVVVGQHYNYVWLFDKEKGAYHWQHKDGLRDWTIYDPWEDVSDKISWDGNYVIHHKENVLSARDERYKTDGRRVWTRKEE